ncbi:hypothetical protein D9M68_795520 [compost metagenome]
MAYVGRQDLPTVLRLARQFLAGCAKVEQREVDQRQANRGDNPGDHRVTGNQAAIADATITNRRGDDDAEHQRAQGIHGQIALQETLHQGSGPVVTGRSADLPGRREYRRTTQHQQRRNEHRGDQLADAIHQLPWIQGEEQHSGKIGRGVGKQRDLAVTGKRGDAYLEGCHGRTRGCEQRADGEVHRHGQCATGDLADRRGKGRQTTTDTRQSDHGQ